jgi:elongation factor 3
MSPAVSATAVPMEHQSKALEARETANSENLISDMLSKLSLTKNKQEAESVAHDVAIFINGDIEEGDAPTK